LLVDVFPEDQLSIVLPSVNMVLACERIANTSASLKSTNKPLGIPRNVNQQSLFDKP